MSDNSRTEPSAATKASEAHDETAAPGADERPENTGTEDVAPRSVDDEVTKHYEEMLERGAHQQGEGRIA